MTDTPATEQARGAELKEFGADAMLAELGFQPSHRGAGFAQCLECGEHVRRTQLDMHIANCPQRSKSETTVSEIVGKRTADPVDLTDEELRDAIEGLEREVNRPGGEMYRDILADYRREADRRGLTVGMGSGRMRAEGEATADKNRNRLYIAEEEDVPYGMDAEFDGEHYVVETGNPDRLAREIAPQSVSRETGFEIEWLEAPKGSTERAVLLAEGLSQRDYDVAQEYVDSGDTPREAIEPAIEDMWGGVNRIDRENALEEAASYLDGNRRMRAEGESGDEMVSEFNTGIDVSPDLPSRRELERKDTGELQDLLDFYYQRHDSASSDEEMRAYLRAIGDIEDILVQRGQMQRSAGETAIESNAQKMNFQNAKILLSDVVESNFPGTEYTVEPTRDGAMLEIGNNSRAIAEAIRDIAADRADRGTLTVEDNGGSYPVRFVTQRRVAREAGEESADKRLGDPTMGPNLPHREELEQKTTANLKRLKGYYLRQYEDEPDIDAKRNIMNTVRDVQDILARRGAVERADNIREDWIEAFTKDEEDPCEDGWTMLGLKPNGNPRCVPEEDVEDYDPDKSFKDEPEPAEGLEDACWDGYVAVGLKPDPNGDGMVPDCVPANEARGESADKTVGTGLREHVRELVTRNFRNIEYELVDLGRGVAIEMAPDNATTARAIETFVEDKMPRDFDVRYASGPYAERVVVEGDREDALMFTEGERGE